jgi:hypothetical protein
MVQGLCLGKGSCTAELFIFSTRRFPVSRLETFVRYLIAAVTLVVATLGFRFVNHPFERDSATQPTALRPPLELALNDGELWSVSHPPAWAAMASRTPDHVAAVDPSQRVLVVQQATTIQSVKQNQISTGAERARPAEIIDRATQNEDLPPSSLVRAVSAISETTTDWTIAGKTTQGRPMHIRRLGNPGARTVIVAGLDGADRIAVRWIDELAGQVAERPILIETQELLIFRAGNPDGLTKKVSENSHGILINRNFPGRRDRPQLGNASGSKPATEAETRTLVDTLKTFQPQCVIHLKSTSNRTTISYNPAAKQRAKELQRLYEVNIHPLDIHQVPGSLEDFADGTLETGVLSIQLNVGSDWKNSWSKYQPVILAAVTGGTSAKPAPIPQSPEEVVRQLPASASSPIPVSANTPRRSPPRSGYEALPAPPK